MRISGTFRNALALVTLAVLLAAWTQAEYYGHDIRYELELDDGSQLAARAQTPELFHEDQRVSIRFDGHPTEAWPTDNTS